MSKTAAVAPVPTAAEAAATNRIPRTTFTFQVPKSARTKDTDPHSFTLRETTLLEDERVVEMTGDKGALATSFESFKMMLVAVNGKPVGPEERETILDTWGSKVRTLALKAQIKVQSPSEDESADFLGSMSIDAS